MFGSELYTMVLLGLLGSGFRIGDAWGWAEGL